MTMEELLNLGIGTIISGIFYSLLALVAIIVGIALYATVFSKKNDGKYTGFAGRLYDFINVKKFSLEPLLKATYIIAALYITLSALLSFSDYSVWRGLGKLAVKIVLENALLRVAYELALLLVRVLKKLDSIGDKLGADGEKSEFADVIFPKAENIAQPAPTPVAQPVPATVAKPAPTPVPQPVPTPVAQPASAPVPQPVPAPMAQPASAPAEEAEAFCTSCGKKINASSKFCPYCGTTR